MIQRNEFLAQHPGLGEGVQVFSQDGENLGKIRSMDEDSFTMEKGFFFPQDFTARYSDIVEVRDSGVVLKQNHGELNEWRDEKYQGWNEFEDANNGRMTEQKLETGTGATERDIRVPVVEEELEAHKMSREKGTVRLRKIVHTELKQLTVPIRKEEIRVERVPASKLETTDAIHPDFKDETVSVTAMEEEVEIRKRPVVKEEVRIEKNVRTENRDFSDTIRKQDVEIEGAEDTTKHRKAG